MDGAKESGRCFNKLMLAYEIKSHGLTIDEFCDAVGISRSTYQLWASGKSGDWTLRKIAKAAEVLGLTDGQIIAIFFARSVPQAEQ